MSNVFEFMVEEHGFSYNNQHEEFRDIMEWLEWRLLPYALDVKGVLSDIPAGTKVVVSVILPEDAEHGD